jgi:radical SAM superfamily enzyme YgiQ (UPF0313 family)
MSRARGDKEFWTGVWYGREKPPVPEWGGRLPVALVFAQPPATALSTLGWQVVWRLLADRPELAVERFFWEGGEAEPRAYDSGRPLADFPVIAFSLNFEEELRGLIEVLDRAGIPARRAARGAGWPLVMAGGPLAFLNPAPAAPGVDLFWVGEAEAGLPELLGDLARAADAGASKAEALAALAGREGVFLPGHPGAPARRAVPAGAPGLLEAPGRSCFVSPEAEFRDMFLLEINRGCPYGCRFCAAGYVYRPPRHAAVQELRAAVEQANPQKVGLVGTALTDWPELLPFLRWLAGRGTKFSLASLRADGLTDELLEFLRRTGTRSLTFALEGASRRLRRAANKNLDEDALLDAVRRVSALRFNHLKVYLIVGWPGETQADYDELGALLGRMAEAVRQGQGGRRQGVEHVTVSASCLVPKPWTPFQWAPMADEAALEWAMGQVRAMVKPLRGFRAMLERPGPARLQGLLARGDEAVFDLAELAARPGMGWRRALKAWEGDPGAYLDRERGRDEAFPWECIDIGVSRDYLWREWERYARARPSARCAPGNCAGCDACGMGGWLAAGGPAQAGPD